MDKLWAPWRVTYITQIVRKTKGCVFCRIFQENKDKENYVIQRASHAYAVLNIYPYNNGHVLIVANRHVDDLQKLRKEERDDLLDLLDVSRSLLHRTIAPEGYNIGINLGKVAGAGFPGHLHIHLVPRWKGDINFMPVTAHTKVISQSLNALYRQLTHANTKRHRGA